MSLGVCSCTPAINCRVNHSRQTPSESTGKWYQITSPPTHHDSFPLSPSSTRNREKGPLKHYRTPVAFRGQTPKETEQFKRQDPRHAENHLEPIFGLQTQTAQPHIQCRCSTQRSAAPAPPRRARPHRLHAGFRAEVGQTSESTGSADIYG